MKLIRFTSGQTYTPFAAAWEYFFCEEDLKIPLEELKKEILDKEKGIIEKYEFEDDWGTKLGAESLTARSNKYNLLNFDSALPLKYAIKKTHDKRNVCWPRATKQTFDVAIRAPAEQLLQTLA